MTVMIADQESVSHFKNDRIDNQPSSILDGPMDSSLCLTLESSHGKHGYQQLEHDHHLQLLPYSRDICSSINAKIKQNVLVQKTNILTCTAPPQSAMA